MKLPRDIGPHPETGKMISAGIGRYGPYVSHDGIFANLESVDEVFSIGLNRAVAVLADKQSKGSGRTRATPAALATLGQHPEGGDVTVRDGRYGPYVNWGKINATLPKGKDPASVTLEEALELIAAKAGSAKSKKAPARKKAEAADEETTSTGKKTTARKTTAGKTTAKKSSAKAKDEAGA